MKIKIVPGTTILSIKCKDFGPRVSALILAASPEFLTVADFNSLNGLATFYPGEEDHYVITCTESEYPDCDIVGQKHWVVESVVIDGTRYQNCENILFVL